MQRGIAGMALLQSNVIDGIMAANEAGYDVLELWAPTVIAYLDDGHDIQEIAAKFEGVPLRAQSIVAVDDIDLPEGPERKLVIENCHRLCGIAQALGCRNVQMVSGVTFDGHSWPTIRTETARGLKERRTSPRSTLWSCPTSLSPGERSGA